MEPIELRDRARRAYEMGRARLGAKAAGAALVIAAAAVLLGRPLEISALLCAALAILTSALAFRGRAAGRAVWTGLAAGSGAMLLPVVLMTAGCAMFGPVCMRFCLPACVVAGCAIGAVVAIRARRQEHEAKDQAAIAEAVSQFQSDMLASADPSRLLGEKVTVIQAVRAAVSELDAGKLGKLGFGLKPEPNRHRIARDGVFSTITVTKTHAFDAIRALESR